MQLFVEIFKNNEAMFLYECISICIGIIFLLHKKDSHILYTTSIYIVCFVNGFLGGTMILFQVFFNKTSFLIGGILGIMFTLVIYLVKKEFITLLFCFWTIFKAFLIAGNCILEHDLPQQERHIFLLAIVTSLIFTFVVIMLLVIYKLLKKKGMDISQIRKYFAVFYGSFLVSGSLYEWIYDVTTQEMKFFGDKMEYINFYKALLKIDWTTDGTGFVFLAICFFLISVGIVRQITNKE